MIDARFVSIVSWPGTPTPNYRQRSAPFRAPYARTLDLLEAELKHLNAKDVLIQAYFQREDIRNDGWPRSNARKPERPGVILTFDVRKGGNAVAMSFPCDTFNGWEDNLRAIALSLEALRKVDRYGVTRNNEQYRGFAALPAADPNLKRTEAVAFISRVTGIALGDVTRDIEGAYRTAARKLHPDSGGRHEDFVVLQRYMEALR